MNQGSVKPMISGAIEAPITALDPNQSEGQSEQTPFPEETRELINEALSKCVERFRFPPEERDKVRRAAELGNPFGQYLWGLVCHYDLGEHLEAWTWFSRSAEHGYHDSVRHLALLLEGGHVPLKGSSRNPDTHARQVREAAARLYLKAAELGSYQAKYQYGLCCLEGLGRPRHYLEAFHWLRLAACKDYKPAQVELARLHLAPHRGYRDPLEAYIWATISAADEVGDLLTELDAKLSSEQIFAAQAEAVRRSGILAERKFITPEELAEFTPPPAKPVSAIALDAQGRPQIWRALVPEKQPQPSPEEDPEPSSGIAYQFVKNIRKKFDPALVEFVLVVPDRILPREEMDFTRLKIRYAGKDTDIKDVALLSPLRVNKAQRKLLIRLAAQNSLPYKEQALKNTRAILSETAAETSISRLNHMFCLMFPDCVTSKSKRMINRRNGLVNIRLSVDTTMLSQARDFEACGL